MNVPWQALIVTFGSGFAFGGTSIETGWPHTLIALAIIGAGAYLLHREGGLGG